MKNPKKLISACVGSFKKTLLIVLVFYALLEQLAAYSSEMSNFSAGAALNQVGTHRCLHGL